MRHQFHWPDDVMNVSLQCCFLTLSNKLGSSGICVGNWIHGLAWGWCLRASRSDPSGLLRAEAFWNSRGQARRRAWCRGQFQRSSPDQSRWGPAPRAKSAPTPCQAGRDPHDSLMSRKFLHRRHQTKPERGNAGGSGWDQERVGCCNPT